MARVAGLGMRGVAPDDLSAPRTAGGDGLFALDWVPLDIDPAPAAAQWTEVAPGSVYAAGVSVIRVAGGDASAGDTVLETAHRVRAWLTDPECAEGRLVVVTRGAVGVDGGEGVPDLATAGVWGALRSVQTEHPGRVFLADVDDWASVDVAVDAVLACGEPQLALRRGAFRVARVVRLDGEAIVGLPSQDWVVGVGGSGVLASGNLTARPLPRQELAEGEVRVAVRSAGVNFRDVLIALGMYPDHNAAIGGEGAGTVLEVGPGVTRFTPGDRVLGILPALASTVTVDHRLLATIPHNWTFSQAAAIPAAMLTAHYALRTLADVQPGQRILIHAGTGGVGMAAIALAQLWNLEIFATASPTKWHTLRHLGINDDHIANSRTLEFEEKFRTTTHGHGMHTILNSLAHEFTDASLRLLPHGGQFIEMGLTDLRDTQHITTHHPGVHYHPFTLTTLTTEQLGTLLTTIMQLFHHQHLHPLPTTAWDIRRLPETYRHISQARHTGKNTLTLPHPLNTNGTVLITGGTGTLGTHLARHLITHHGIHNLLLLSRQGPTAPGATQLTTELQELGAHITITACDTTNRQALRHTLDHIPPHAPLTGIIHAAGTLDDATFTQLTDTQWHTVLRTKIDTARNLHELTTHHDLALFALFSSIAGTLGSPGQANYAAANAYLDALAQHRHHHGLPATSLAWGLWQQPTTMTQHLTPQDTARINRTGILPMTTTQALTLFDTALTTGHPTLIPAQLTTTHTTTETETETPHILRHLKRTRRTATNTTTHQHTTLATQLTGHTPPEQNHIILELIRTQAAIVLGHDTSTAITPDETFKDLGFDSLSAVEFRNRLQTTTGLKLPATTVFDHPTPMALVEYIRQNMPGIEKPNGSGAGSEYSESYIRALLERIPIGALRESGMIEIALRLARTVEAAPAAEADEGKDITTLDVDELIDFAMKQ